MDTIKRFIDNFLTVAGIAATGWFVAFLYSNSAELTEVAQNTFTDLKKDVVLELNKPVLNYVKYHTMVDKGKDLQIQKLKKEKDEYEYKYKKLNYQYQSNKPFFRMDNGYRWTCHADYWGV